MPMTKPSKKLLFFTQEKVTRSKSIRQLAKLAAAEKKLDGKPTNFTDLQKLVEYDMHYQAISIKFIYASENVSSIFRKRTPQAKAVLTIRGLATEVKEAIANLKVARETNLMAENQESWSQENQDKLKLSSLFRIRIP